MKQRPMMQYGFTAFNGVTFRNDQVDSYNRVQERINSFIREGRQVPEHVLNGSHNIFKSYAKLT